ncbi:hypothetical protein ABBZ21_19725 [Acinetobacter baumannii]|uniref:hypothetical protein n=1 Tax=Acinetobacter baumannii TaxID=470 RepID=UPI00385CD3A7
MNEVTKLINGFRYFETPEELHKITKTLKKYSSYRDIAQITILISALFGVISIGLVALIRIFKNVPDGALTMLIVTLIIFAVFLIVGVSFKLRSDNMKEFEFKMHFSNARIKDFDSIVYIRDDVFKALASSELINKYSELAKESNDFSIFLNNLIKKRNGNLLYVDTLMLGSDYINDVLSIIKSMKETKQDSINSLNHLKNTINYQS